MSIYNAKNLHDKPALVFNDSIDSDVVIVNRRYPDHVFVLSAISKTSAAAVGLTAALKKRKCTDVQQCENMVKLTDIIGGGDE